MTTSMADRWHRVAAQVDAACARAKRPPGDVSIVAVSKHQPASAIAEAMAAGASCFGENYVQEWSGKRDELSKASGEIRWHFVGALQRNKAKFIAGEVELVHSVDSVELGRELGRRAVARGREQSVLIAVNLAGEASKSGVRADALKEILDGLRATHGIRVDGLMTMPPPSDDPSSSRKWFRELRELRDACDDAPSLPFLSMGMSDDFEVAIEEGATHVRIGTAIFGPRTGGATR